MRDLDEHLDEITELFEIEEVMEKLSVASTCTYVRSPTFDATCDLHENSYGESYVPTLVSSDLEDSDWEV